MKAPLPVHPAWRTARRILCVRQDGIAAVLMCTPALRALRTALPGSSLTLLCGPAGAAAAPCIPEIDEIIVQHTPSTADGDWSAVQDGAALIETLAAGAFDGAVIFTSHGQSALPAALLCHLAGIPLRLAHCRENHYGLLSDWIPEHAPGVRHEVQRQLDLVRRIGCAAAGLRLSFVPPAADHATAARLLEAEGIDPAAPWIALHPGAGAPARRYPPDHWAELVALLAASTALPLVLTGSAAEIPLVDHIRRRAALPAVSLAGRLGLGELGAALRLAAVAVAGSSGPAHIAAAVGTPLVDVYALTHPGHTPWGGRSRVLFHDVSCRFCGERACPQGHQACVAGVAPARVAEAVRDLLACGRPALQAGNSAGNSAGDPAGVTADAGRAAPTLP